MIRGPKRWGMRRCAELSIKTVSTYRKRVLEKTEVHRHGRPGKIRDSHPIGVVGPADIQQCWTNQRKTRP